MNEVHEFDIIFATPDHDEGERCHDEHYQTDHEAKFNHVQHQLIAADLLNVGVQTIGQESNLLAAQLNQKVHQLTEILHLLTQHHCLPLRVLMGLEGLNHKVDSIVEAAIEGHVEGFSVVSALGIRAYRFSIDAVLVASEVFKLLELHNFKVEIYVGAEHSLVVRVH